MSIMFMCKLFASFLILLAYGCKSLKLGSIVSMYLEMQKILTSGFLRSMTIQNEIISTIKPDDLQSPYFEVGWLDGAVTRIRFNVNGSRNADGHA